MNNEWQQDPEIVALIENKRKDLVEYYKKNPSSLQEHLKIESNVSSGGYQGRYLYELIQNAVDAASESLDVQQKHKIKIIINKNNLYIANTGKPFTLEGIDSILHSNISTKKENQIGRFGIGFKSILDLFTDLNRAQIKIYSKNVSLEFNNNKNHFLGFLKFPLLRVAWIIDRKKNFEDNIILQELSLWADTIIYIPNLDNLKSEQILNNFKKFESEFCLFLNLDIEIIFQSENFEKSIQNIKHNDQQKIFIDKKENSSWYVFKDIITVPIEIQKSAGDQGREKIPIYWAISNNQDYFGKFWMFFPLNENCQVPGIWNAPWQVNTERTNLMPGNYNNYILEKMSNLFIDSIQKYILNFQSSEDVGRFLDFFPRDYVYGSTFSEILIQKIEEKTKKTNFKIHNSLKKLENYNKLKLHPESIDYKFLSEIIKYKSADYLNKYIHPDLQKPHRYARIKKFFMYSPSYDIINDTTNYLINTSCLDSCKLIFKILIELKQKHWWSDLKKRINLKIIDQNNNIQNISSQIYLSSPSHSPVLTLHPELQTLDIIKFLKTEYNLEEYKEDLESYLKICIKYKDWENLWNHSYENNWEKIIRENCNDIHLHLKARNSKWYPYYKFINYGIIFDKNHNIDNTDHLEYFIDLDFHEKYESIIKFFVLDIPFLKSSEELINIDKYTNKWNTIIGYNEKIQNQFKEYYQFVLKTFKSNPKYKGKNNIRSSHINISINDCIKDNSPKGFKCGYIFSQSINLILDEKMSIILTEHILNKILPGEINISYKNNNNEDHIVDKYLSSLLIILFKFGNLKLNNSNLPLIFLTIASETVQYLENYLNNEKSSTLESLIEIIKENYEIIEKNKNFYSHFLTCEKLNQKIINNYFLLNNEIEESQNYEITEDKYDEEINESSNLELFEKLLKIVDSQILLEQLPENIQNLIKTKKINNNLQISNLFISYYGFRSLIQIKDHLKDSVALPQNLPSIWRGGQAELQYVRDLGFPDIFAGISSQLKKYSWEDVTVPYPIKELHDYQKDIFTEFELLFNLNQDNLFRSLISMPTGSGKTRVAVEIAIQKILNQSHLDNPTVIWVAQSRELCEQAILCFSQVWPWVAEPGKKLRISRWFEGNKLSTCRGPHLIVTTNRTVYNNSKSKLNPNLIIIDEAHGATTKTYTDIFQNSCPIVGLSATPFRRIDQESEILVKKFRKNLIPNSQKQKYLYQNLENDGYLSNIDYYPIENSKEFEFTNHEIDKIEKYNELPKEVLEKIGNDPDRNQKIIDYIQNNHSQQTLIFASSVKSAQLISALITLQGISSACVHGETHQHVRDYFIDQFKSNQIRILVNCDLLTTGFDAPQVDTIIIARPTFSLVLYQQMIGRGLRGPKNGGKERCTIVTIKDNLGRFSDRLAFRKIQNLWKDDSDLGE